MPTTLLPPRFSDLPTALHLGRTGLHRQKWSSSLGFNNWWTIGCKKSFKNYVDKINFVLSCTLLLKDVPQNNQRTDLYFLSNHHKQFSPNQIKLGWIQTGSRDFDFFNFPWSYILGENRWNHWLIVFVTLIPFFQRSFWMVDPRHHRVKWGIWAILTWDRVHLF